MVTYKYQDELRPFYVAIIAMTGLHVLLACGLFFRKRSKFPVNGHSTVLSTMVAVPIALITMLNAYAGLESVETCSVVFGVAILLGFAAMNFLAAKAICLWYKIGLKGKLVEVSEAANKNFRPAILVGIATCLTAVELAVAGTGLSALAKGGLTGLTAETPCGSLLPFVYTLLTQNGITAACIFAAMQRCSTYKDGIEGAYKSMLRWWVLCQTVLSAPIATLLIWEAFDDLPYYAAPIRVFFDFVAANIMVFVTLSRPALQSLSSDTVKKD